MDIQYRLLAQKPLADKMQVRRRSRIIADYSPATTNDYVVCAAVESARKIRNKWRLIVVRYLLEHPMRFNELMRVARNIDPKTLSRVLKYLARKRSLGEMFSARSPSLSSVPDGEGGAAEACDAIPEGVGRGLGAARASLGAKLV